MTTFDRNRPTKPLFTPGASAGLRLWIAVALSAALMTADHKAQHLEAMRSILFTLIYPIQYLVDAPIQATRWVKKNLLTRDDLHQEVAGLRRQQLLLQSRLAKLDELEAENRRLRKLLDSSVKVADRVLIAELLAVDMDPFSRRIVLNKGTRDGVVVGQSVIDASGIMGQIVHAAPFSSSALLITDSSHALPIQVNRTGLRSIAVGVGARNLLELAHVPDNADVRVGDLVVTSGLGGRFPAGYPVGRIVEVERGAGRPYARVMLEPSARLERNREVLLLWHDAEKGITDSSVTLPGSRGKGNIAGARR